ncbi:HNH endonuclease signature motif containing protein [Cryobacterium sp. SO1]|uniref:HNH endonuclease signature motif containing protein n=1 Tax=Cryobacterium sp. SO1 TaxID=1897061 RepID=UPI00210DD0CE|nr:HNH endonuclease signature motif containing protein [Cryobacterium sp. SO1]
MATSDATPKEPRGVALDPTVDPVAAAINAVIDPLIANEKVIAAGYAERTRLLAELDRLGHDPRIIAGLCGDPVESGRNDPDTGAHGPAWDDEELARRCMAAEAAGALRLKASTAGMMVFNAVRLTDQLPQFHQALRRGSITWGHAVKMLDLTDGVPEEILPAFEAKVLPAAEKLTSTQFVRVAGRILERMHPVPLQTRADAGFITRRVVLRPDADGMAWLNAYLKAEDAQAIYDRLSRIAATLDTDASAEASTPGADPAGTGEPRTKDQRRADAYRDLLRDGVGPAGLGHGIRGTVHVTVPALTLLGRSDEPAILEGYGPIDPEAARRIAGTATSWSRILTHPETGCRLSMGREQYAPPADMRRYLDARDRTCQGIGCTRRATLSEIDHTRPWNTGGPTDVDNLVKLCKSCHRLKHQSSFTTNQGPGGALTWTTPAGRKYASAPANTDPATYDPATYDQATLCTAANDPATLNPTAHDSPPPKPINSAPSAPQQGSTDTPPPF